MPVVAVGEFAKSFGEHKVLNGISLSVSRGETLAVLGRSGTGKSVSVEAHLGLEKPDSGSVRIHGAGHRRPDARPDGEIRKKMGFLFQHAALYDSLTVAENVAFPLDHHRERCRSPNGLTGWGSCWQRWVWKAASRRCPPIFLAECKSAWAWRVRWLWSPTFCCSMSPRPVSTPSVPGKSTI